MIELTITRSLIADHWWVGPKHQTANRMISPLIKCDSADEAMTIFQELNGKKLQEIEAFIKLRKRLGV